MRNFSKSLNLKNIDKSVSNIRIRFPFESSFWISASGCKLTILPDIQPANRIVIISARHQPHFSGDARFEEKIFFANHQNKVVFFTANERDSIFHQYRRRRLRKKPLQCKTIFNIK